MKNKLKEEEELKSLWNAELAAEQQRVQNYFLGQVKRKFAIILCWNYWDYLKFFKSEKH